MRFKHDCSPSPLTHLISVLSFISKEPDTKSFRISATCSAEEIASSMKKFCDEELEKRFADTVEIVGMKKKKNSHGVRVVGIIDKKDYKSFTINFPSYSSKDLAVEFSKFLCNGAVLI